MGYTYDQSYSRPQSPAPRKLGQDEDSIAQLFQMMMQNQQQPPPQQGGGMGNPLSGLMGGGGGGGMMSELNASMEVGQKLGDKGEDALAEDRPGGRGAIEGAKTGASIGTRILPGWGSVIGAIVGAAGGYFAGRKTGYGEK